MNEIPDDGKDILGFVMSYNLSIKIRCESLPHYGNIEFVKSDDGNYLLGVNVKFLGTDFDTALEDSRIIPDKIACVITSKTKQYVTVSFGGYSGIPKPGKTARLSKSATFLYNIKGNEPLLDFQKQDLNVLKLNDSQHSLLQRLSRAILHNNSGLPEESLKEIYSIIEHRNDFLNRDKYSCLRHLFTHTPNINRSTQPYRENTITNFMKHYNKNDFDYLEFDYEKNLIILDINSRKTQKKLESVMSEFIQEVESYLKKELFD
jgi:hypothetical protein